MGPDLLPFWDRYKTDPDFAEAVDEEARSIGESVGYIIRTARIAGPDPCEACGAPVTVVLEAAWHDRDAWQPGGWELDATGARHTARRCAWTRTHPALPRAA